MCVPGGIAESLLLAQPFKPVVGILQIKVLRAECQQYDSKKKSYDKTPNPYLKIAVGSGNAWQQVMTCVCVCACVHVCVHVRGRRERMAAGNDKVTNPNSITGHDILLLALTLQTPQCDTRVVRATTAPVYNEYLEFLVRDLAKDVVSFSMESQDGFFKNILGTLRVPVMAAARGDVLQKWLPFQGEGASRATVLLEMRVAFIEWQGQTPPASEKWRAHFEKQREGGLQGSAHAGAKGGSGSRSSRSAAGDDIAIDEEGEWSLLVDLSKTQPAGRKSASSEGGGEGEGCVGVGGGEAGEEPSAESSALDDSTVGSSALGSCALEVEGRAEEHDASSAGETAAGVHSADHSWCEGVSQGGECEGGGGETSA
jgi:hypothetical protein